MLSQQDIKVQLQLCLVALSSKKDDESAQMVVRMVQLADSRALLTPDEWCQCFNVNSTQWNSQVPALINIMSLSADPIVSHIRAVLKS